MARVQLKGVCALEGAKVPELDGAVLGGRCHVDATLGERHSSDSGAVALKRLHHLGLGNVPHAHSTAAWADRDRYTTSE